MCVVDSAHAGADVMMRVCQSMRGGRPRCLSEQRPPYLDGVGDAEPPALLLLHHHLVPLPQHGHLGRVQRRARTDATLLVAHAVPVEADGGAAGRGQVSALNRGS